LHLLSISEIIYHGLNSHHKNSWKSIYSILKLFTGFAIAAFIAWKLIVAKAIAKAMILAARKIH